MKLKEYAWFIAKLAEKYPDAQVVFARDEEGNGFEPVDFAPIAGECGGIVTDSDNVQGLDFNGGIADWTQDGYVPDPNIKVNAVCVN